MVLVRVRVRDTICQYCRLFKRCFMPIFVHYSLTTLKNMHSPGGATINIVAYSVNARFKFHYTEGAAEQNASIYI